VIEEALSKAIDQRSTAAIREELLNFALVLEGAETSSEPSATLQEADVFAVVPQTLGHPLTPRIDVASELAHSDGKGMSGMETRPPFISIFLAVPRHLGTSEARAAASAALDRIWPEQVAPHLFPDADKRHRGGASGAIVYARHMALYRHWLEWQDAKRGTRTRFIDAVVVGSQPGIDGRFAPGSVDAHDVWPGVVGKTSVRLMLVAAREWLDPVREVDIKGLREYLNPLH
jgi:hypothetical protein